MAVLLEDLVPSVKAQLNPLGGPAVVTDDDDEAIIQSLADAFWTAKVTGGFFSSYRVNLAGTQIENVNGGADLPREEQQIVVLMLTLTTLEAKLAAVPNRRKAKAGPNEVERETSASILTALLKSKREAYDALVLEVRRAGRGSNIGVFDQAALAAACGSTFVL